MTLSLFSPFLSEYSSTRLNVFSFMAIIVLTPYFSGNAQEHLLQSDWHFSQALLFPTLQLLHIGCQLF